MIDASALSSVDTSTPIRMMRDPELEFEMHAPQSIDTTLNEA